MGLKLLMGSGIMLKKIWENGTTCQREVGFDILQFWRIRDSRVWHFRKPGQGHPIPPHIMLVLTIVLCGWCLLHLSRRNVITFGGDITFDAGYFNFITFADKVFHFVALLLLRL